MKSPPRKYQWMKRLVNYGGTVLGLCDTWALLNISEKPLLGWSILFASAILGAFLFEVWARCLEIMNE